ncbi:hypothetical protein [Bradyrhizobium sp. SZCCHNRI20481]|uniref:hypothetical protein n=1 Tax=Bradyrhizobium sp. SZCCHNRI20481 TaxID=3057286 RepID=UPI0029162C5D|nr:hypothetical protein [Bradyrhizobium sp. SZCCHNRI20481]
MKTNGSRRGDPAPNEYQADPRDIIDDLPDDFRLIQLDTKFRTLLSEVCALQRENDREIDDLAQLALARISSDDDATLTRAAESVLCRLEPIEREIMATPARTIVGLGIKAWHAAYVVSEHWDAPIEHIDWDARAIRLLIEAVCEVAGVRLPFPNLADLQGA